jgi:hypothetical protein
MMMVSMMEMRLLIVTGMILFMIVLFSYSYYRDQATQSKRLVRIPVKTRENRRQTPLPEEETNEIPPTVYYVIFLFAAYLLAMILLAG